MAEGEGQSPTAKIYETPTVKKLTDRSYYEVLGVPRSADADQVKAAYRSRSRAIHPDLGGASEKASREEFTKQLNAARDILVDPNKRKDYDAKLVDQEAKNAEKARQSALRREATVKAIRAEAKRKKDAEVKRAAADGQAKRDAEARERQRAEALRRNKEDEARRLAQEARDLAWRQQQEDDRKARDKEYNDRQEAYRLEQETRMKSEENIIKDQGIDMGRRLGSWIYTDEGLAKQQEIRELLIRAAKKREGLLSAIGPQTKWESQVDVLMNGMRLGNSLGVLSGSGADISKILFQKWKKEGATEIQAAEKWRRLTLDMTEIAVARYHDQEAKYKRNPTIPAQLDPEVGFNSRYDYVYHLGLELRAHDVKQLYTQAFGSEWNSIKAKYEQSHPPAVSAP